MATNPDLLKSLLHQGAILPQEEMLELKPKKGQLFIGIPKETSFQERRVALVPEAVSLLVANGHRVRIETGAGEGTNFSDNEYSEAGGEIVYNQEQIYTCDMIFKVAPPTEAEIAMMPGNQTFISALQIATQPKEILQKLMAKKTTCIAWDYIRDEEHDGRNCRKHFDFGGGRTAIMLLARQRYDARRSNRSSANGGRDHRGGNGG